jgi:hypothetical protein
MIREAPWASGFVARELLEAILVYPQMEPAGRRVFSDEKDRADAGGLRGYSAEFSHHNAGKFTQWASGHAELDRVEALLALEESALN